MKRAAGQLLRRGGPFGLPQGAPTASAALLRAPDAAETLAPEGSRGVSRQIVKQRMKSVGNIAKITKAMKMVAASRLRGVQSRMEQSRGLSQPITRLLGDQPGAAAAKTVCLPVTSDKGLCGGINSTVVKYSKLVEAIAEASGSRSAFTIIGEKGRAQLARGALAAKVAGCVVDTAKSKDGLSFAAASMVADHLLKEGYDKLQVVYNRFQSVIAFKPTVATLLSPGALEAAADETTGLLFDTYELEGPDKGEFLLDLTEFQAAAVLYNALLENSTSELGSRMQSMENSTKNAQEMLAKLTLYYNRTRQAAITTELIEIISGAAALEG